MPGAAFLRALLEVELHVHLVGSASVPTIARLAARHGAASGVPSDPDALAALVGIDPFAPADVLTAGRAAAREEFGDEPAWIALAEHPFARLLRAGVGSR